MRACRIVAFSAPRCDADTVPVRIGCEEGQPEPCIMRLVQDRDALGLPLLEDRVDLVGPTVDGQANLTGTWDVRGQILELARPQSVTTQELASALGVSLRTITRDLNWLRDAGLPVTAQRGRLGGVTMPPGSGLDLTRLTPGERDHLSLTGLDENQRAELNASVESQRALSKIGATQSRRIHELLPLTDVVHVDSRPWLQARASGTTPASLISSVRRGRRLRIEYDSPRESGPRDLVVDPYGLFAKAGNWYLVADCAQVPQMYRLERITT